MAGGAPPVFNCLTDIVGHALNCAGGIRDAFVNLPASSVVISETDYGTRRTSSVFGFGDAPERSINTPLHQPDASLARLAFFTRLALCGGFSDRLVWA